MKRILAIICSIALTITTNTSKSQVGQGSLGGQIVNSVTTAVPFLRIAPDARSGGMGDVGIAISPDANGVWLNPSKMAFIERDFGFALTYTPWLRGLVNDIYMANATGYYKIKEMQTIAFGIRYFSLGNITFTDINNQVIGQFRPNEFAIDAHYARRLGKYFSIGASLRFIYSNLAQGQVVGGDVVRAGIAGAGDISWTFNKNIPTGGMTSDVMVGMNISNIGNKISYTNSSADRKDFIPTNLGIGIGYALNIDNNNTVGFYTDINKLMVPTPDPNDPNQEWRQKSPVAGMFTSFGDAPGGFTEEMREFTVGVGAEYMYNKQFGVRAGYFYEHPTKGARQFLTAGVTVKYSIVGLNFSYLIPTTVQRNPLDNTLRFTLLFDFWKGGITQKQQSGATGSDTNPYSREERRSRKKDVAPSTNPNPDN